MEQTSEYWFVKKAISEDDKKHIRSMVSGSVIGELNIDGQCHQILSVSGEVFRKVFIENRKYLYLGDYTAPPDENDYIDSTNYLSDDGLAGFSITKDGWLVSLFSNYMNGGFTNAIKKYVVNNAYKLVCIVADSIDENRLIKVYKDMFGFEVYATTVNDVEIMRKYYGDVFIDSFVEKHGIPFHVFMVDKNAITDVEEIVHFTDYFKALKFVNDTVHKD